MESAERVDGDLCQVWKLESGGRPLQGAVRVSPSVVVRPDKIKSRILAWYLA